MLGRALVWSSVPRTTTDSAPSMPKSEPLWPEGLLKVIWLLLPPPSPPLTKHLSIFVMSIIGLFWPSEIEKNTQTDLNEKLKGIVLAQFTSKSEENLTSGMTGPNRFNRIIKAWSPNTPRFCSLHGGLVLSIIKRPDGARSSRPSSSGPAEDLRM